MTAGLGACVMLAVLCTSCLGLPFSDEVQHSISAPAEVALPEADTQSLAGAHARHSRSTAQLKDLPGAEEDGDSRANLSELLARLISTRKGSVRRNSSANKEEASCGPTTG
ncbi:hypothetical protein OJAV_G00106760 [Oryzias javanicus]|uniref:Gastrin/cholecystokinin peptide hormone domain-containing protein n=1 Tax=Oryzias javanicus TaxID=123683 RepID=A0A3S2PPG2_ORYJA|nr:hypothetical protein OJAV_G00106760 [Oryzias javanicus]